MEKVVRKIIKIDEEKCDGCGLCIPSCAEGALQIVDGKARLVKDVYCDGLGNCLGECPQGAIEMIEREAEPFDEEAVEERLKELESSTSEAKGEEAEEACGICCGSAVIKDIKPHAVRDQDKLPITGQPGGPEPELSHWPVQLHLVNPDSNFLNDSDLLIAADCVPFAYADFHREFLAGHSLVIGCPKLDDVDAYHQKLVQIFKNNNLKSLTLVHMEVGCCFGLSRLVKTALQESGANIPLKEIIVNVDGTIKQ
jgi:ferredoxin